MNRKLKVALLRCILPSTKESLPHMRVRIQKTAFWRGVFRQAEMFGESNPTTDETELHLLLKKADHASRTIFQRPENNSHSFWYESRIRFFRALSRHHDDLNPFIQSR
jgi:hypothetical protein